MTMSNFTGDHSIFQNLGLMPKGENPSGPNYNARFSIFLKTINASEEIKTNLTILDGLGWKIVNGGNDSRIHADANYKVIRFPGIYFHDSQSNLPIPNQWTETYWMGVFSGLLVHEISHALDDEDFSSARNLLYSNFHNEGYSTESINKFLNDVVTLNLKNETRAYIRQFNHLKSSGYSDDVVNLAMLDPRALFDLGGNGVVELSESNISIVASSYVSGLNPSGELVIRYPEYYLAHELNQIKHLIGANTILSVPWLSLGFLLQNRIRGDIKFWNDAAKTAYTQSVIGTESSSDGRLDFKNILFNGDRVIELRGQISSGMIEAKSVILVDKGVTLFVPDINVVFSKSSNPPRAIFDLMSGAEAEVRLVKGSDVGVYVATRLADGRLSYFDERGGIRYVENFEPITVSAGSDQIAESTAAALAGVDSVTANSAELGQLQSWLKILKDLPDGVVLKPYSDGSTHLIDIFGKSIGVVFRSAQGVEFIANEGVQYLVKSDGSYAIRTQIDGHENIEEYQPGGSLVNLIQVYTDGRAYVAFPSGDSDGSRTAIEFQYMVSPSGEKILTEVLAVNGQTVLSDIVGGVDLYLQKWLPNLNSLLGSNPDKIRNLQDLASALLPISLDAPSDVVSSTDPAAVLEYFPELGLTVTVEPDAGGFGAVLVKLIDNSGRVINSLTARPWEVGGTWEVDVSTRDINLEETLTGDKVEAALHVIVRVRGSGLDDINVIRISGLGSARAPTGGEEIEAVDRELTELKFSAEDLLFQPLISFGQLISLAVGATSADAYGYLPPIFHAGQSVPTINDPLLHGLGGLHSVFSSLSSHNTFGFLASAFDILAHNSANLGSPGLLEISESLGIVNGVISAHSSLQSFVSALERGDILGIASSGLEVAKSILRYYRSTLLDEISNSGNMVGTSRMMAEQLKDLLKNLDVATTDLSALGDIAAIVGILNSLSREDVGGAASSTALLAGNPMLAAVISMVNLIVGLENDPQGQALWVNQADAGGLLRLQAINPSDQERDGGNVKALGLADQFAAHMNSLLATEPDMGFIAQRLGRVVVDGNQVYAITPDPLNANVLEHMHYDGLGRLIAFGHGAVNASPTLQNQTTLHKWNLLSPLEYLMAAAVDNQAYVPQWMVLTAKMQAERGDPMAGWSARQRASTHGQLVSEEAAASNTMFKPIVVALDADGYVTSRGLTLLTGDRRVMSDVDGDGYDELTNWIYADAGMLVLDMNGNGRIDGSTEMFNDSRLSLQARGLAQLAVYDANGDHQIDAQDPVYTHLKIWRDLDADGRVDDAELRLMSDRARGGTLQYEGSIPTLGGYEVIQQPLEFEANGFATTVVGNSVVVIPEGRQTGFLQVLAALDLSTAGTTHAVNGELIEGMENLVSRVDVRNLLSNDRGQGPLKIVAVSTNPGQGTVSLQSGGTLVYYEPPANQHGTFKFNYTVADVNGTILGTAETTVTVAPVERSVVLSNTKGYASLGAFGLNAIYDWVSEENPPLVLLDATNDPVAQTLDLPSGLEGISALLQVPVNGKQGYVMLSGGELYWTPVTSQAGQEVWNKVLVADPWRGQVVPSDSSVVGVDAYYEITRAPLFGDVMLNPETGAWRYTRAFGTDRESQVGVAGDYDSFEVSLKGAGSPVSLKVNVADPMRYPEPAGEGTQVVPNPSPGQLVDSTGTPIAGALGDTANTNNEGTRPADTFAPIVLDLGNDGVQLISISNSHAFFDVVQDEGRKHVGWVSGRDGILVYDADANGEVTDASELGLARYKPGAKTDLEGLAAFDTDHDGRLTKADAQWASFYIWRDVNEDGMQEVGELYSLDQYLILSINLQSSPGGIDPTRNVVHGWGTYTYRGGGTGVLADVSLSVGTDVWLDDMDDSLVARAGGDTVYAGAGNDTLQGSDGPDTLGGEAGDDRITGGAGDDALYGHAGNDRIQGNAGNDQLWGGYGNDYLMGDEGHDRLYGGDGEDVLSGGEGNDLLFGDANNDVLQGGNGDDVLHGGTGQDMLVGGEGNDILNGDAGADKATGGMGNDIYVIDNSLDEVFESANEGVDTVISQVDIWLTPNVEVMILAGKKPIQALGNDLNNRLYGNQGNNLLIGGGGADYMDGGAGDDTYHVDDAGDVVVEHADGWVSTFSGEAFEFGLLRAGFFNAYGHEAFTGSQWGVDTVVASIDYTLGEGLENLVLNGEEALTGTGNALNNTLRANDWGSVLRGAQGNDLLVGGRGSDDYLLNLGDGSDVIQDQAPLAEGSWAVLDRIVFGAGVSADSLVLSREGDHLRVHYGSQGDQVLIQNWFGSEAGRIERFVFADGSLQTPYDVSTAMNRAPVLMQSLPNVTLQAGVPWRWDIPANVFIDPDGDSLSLSVVDKVLIGLPSWLVFDAATRSLKGTPPADLSADLSLNLRLQATDGHLHLTYADFVLQVKAVVAVNHAPVVQEGISDTQVNVGATLALQLPTTVFKDSDANDTLTLSAKLADGQALPAWLTFDARTAQFRGVPSASDLGALTVRVTATDKAGASAFDDFVVAIKSSEPTPPPGALVGTPNVDRLQADAAHLEVWGLGSDDRLFGFWQSTHLVGGEGNDYIEAVGGPANVLDGGPGNDTLIGAWGEDTLLGGEGNNIIRATGGNSLITAGAGDDQITSNWGSDVIWAGAGANTVNAGGGKNHVVSGDGNDVIRAESGDDYVYAGGGQNRVEVGEGRNIVVTGQGVDTVVAQGSNTVLAGGGNDTITLGWGNDWVYGGAGDDRIDAGGGANLFAFNRGDGNDVWIHSQWTQDTLSLGGGIALSDLQFAKRGNDLVVKTGGDDSITLSSWFAGAQYQGVKYLQVLSSQIQASSSSVTGDAVMSRPLVVFDFTVLTQKFSAAVGVNAQQANGWMLQSQLASTQVLGNVTAQQLANNSNPWLTLQKQVDGVLATPMRSAAQLQGQTPTEAELVLMGVMQAQPGGQDLALGWRMA